VAQGGRLHQAVVQLTAQHVAQPLPHCHLNGQLQPLAEARISPLDRSFLFGDGVYEVMPVYNGRMFRPQSHLDRLARSAAAIRLRNPHTHAQWMQLLQELVAANGGGDQYAYLQLSRGAEFGRNHAPLPDVPPTVFAFCSPWPVVAERTLNEGLACITAQDTRWARCDIKSVALLANVLLRQLAVDANAAETILLRDGELMEASASTVHVVRAGVLLTPFNSQRILPGTTRSVVEEIADSLGIVRRDSHISEAQLRAADEIWLAAATREVQPVTRLDGKPVGSGTPGPLWRRVYDAWQQLKRRESHTAPATDMNRDSQQSR
jgi:D-alanine transaminase